jgi:hypothetical protein
MPNNIRQQPIYMRSGDPETENEATLQYPGQLGMRVTVAQPSRTAPGNESGRPKTYQLVKTDSTMTVTPFPGAVAFWADRANYLVTTAATNQQEGAGVFQNAITAGNYGFIQVQGPATVKFVDADVAALAAGDAAIPSSTAGKAGRVAKGTAPTYSPLGFVAVNLAKDVLNATAIVDLDVRETV